ncbi:MAG: hypothetical protein Q9188_004390 [Gyalolechia gomerana]
MSLLIEERDEAGNLTATYVASASSDEKGKSDGRVDIVYPEKGDTIWTRLLAIFLPAGYPHSVTEDYMWYQIYVGNSVAADVQLANE